MNNKSLIVAENGLMYKIKLFFNNLFKKSNKGRHDMDINKTTESFSNKSNFQNDIKIEPDVERKQLLKLQKDYESGIIKEENMTEEQVNKIEKLYKEQISKLRDDYIRYRNKASNLKDKMASNH